MILEREGDLEQALAAYQSATGFADRVGDVQAGCAASAKAAVFSVAFDPTPATLERARRTLVEVRHRLQASFPRYSALALSWLAIVEHLDGRLDEAILHHDEAMKLLEPLHDEREAGRAAGFAALAYAEVGDLSRAHELAERAAKLLAHREWHFYRAWVTQVQLAITDPAAPGVLNRLESRLTVALSGRRTGSRGWVFDPDGRSFTPPEGMEVDLSRRGPMSRILRALLEARATGGAGLDRHAVAGAGWPGQQLVDEAARSRVYTAVRSLRRMGLEPLLITRDDGYLLDPACPVVIRRPDPG